MGMRSYYLIDNKIQSLEETDGGAQQLKKSKSASILAEQNVLIVDDSPINLIVAEKTLSKFGATCFRAISAKEGLKVYNQEKIDLILMDLHMPVIDGFKATDLIRETEKFHSFPIPIMAYTTFSYDEVMEGIKNHKLDGYIGKPFTQAQVIGSIFEVLSLKQQKYKQA
jgi:two-component system cell cycle response regulator DivK